MMNLGRTLLRVLGRGPQFRGKDRILRAFANPDTHPPVSFEVDFFGHRYTGDLSSYIDWWVFYYGAYSPDELAFLHAAASALRHSRQSLTFFDVGANVGHHALFMSSLVDYVHAFEPYAVVGEKLQDKVVNNGLTNISLHALALGEADGLVRFSPPAGGNLGTGHLRADGAIEVPLRRGDALLDELRLPRIDILKVDVEGHEAAVFRGLSARLKRDRPIILTEISGADRSGFENAASFQDALYPDHRIYRLTQAQRGCVLRGFDLASAHEVVVIPVEVEEALLHVGLKIRA
jgi:FkbM family methyltransferase